MAGELQHVTLGAGKWYVAPYESGEIDMTTVAVESNILGWTQGGAEITYTPELKTIEDDLGMVRKVFMTKAAAEMKTGLLTFNMSSIASMLSVGEVSTSEGGKTVLKLGGGKSALRKFAVVFEYEDDETGRNIRVGMIATNTSPLKFAFKKDTETVVDAIFTAESNGVNDVIIVFEEDPADGTNSES